MNTSMKKNKGQDEFEEKMFEQVDKNDSIIDDEIKAIKEKNEKEGYFKRIMEWNNPKYLIVFAIIGAAFTGASQPLFGGLVMGKVLTYLSIPVDLFPVAFPGQDLET